MYGDLWKCETTKNVCIALTNTNNQNISWDNFSTFKHNLLHLEEDRMMRQRRGRTESVSIFPKQNFTDIQVWIWYKTNWHNVYFPTLPFHPHLWPLSRYRSCRISHFSLKASAGTTEFKLQVTELKREEMWGYNTRLPLSLSLCLTIMVTLPISRPSVFWYGSSLLPITVILEALSIK